MKRDAISSNCARHLHSFAIQVGNRNQSQLLKRRFLNRAGWARLLRSEYEQIHYDEPAFNGVAGVLYILQLREPLFVQKFNPAADTVCIADSGYIWIGLVQKQHNYAITAMYDDRGQLVEYYIDICLPYRFDEQGHAYFDDLYLDIVLYPDGHIDLLDEDELEDAFNHGQVSQAQYETAYRVRADLLLKIQAGTFPDPWTQEILRTLLHERMSHARR